MGGRAKRGHLRAPRHAAAPRSPEAPPDRALGLSAHQPAGRSRTAGCSTRRTPACSGRRRSTCAPACSIRRRWCSIPTSCRPTDRSRWRNSRRRPMRSGWPMRSPKGGADWETVRVRNVATGEDLADAVAWVRFSELSWTHDSKGFFYSRYPEPPKHKVLEAALSGQAVYYHRLGTPQSDDRADLSAAGSPVVDRQRHGQRRRPLRVHHARIAAPTTTTSCTSSTSEHPGTPNDHGDDQADRRDARRRIHADRQLPVAPLRAQRQGRAEPPHHRDRSRAPRSRRRGRSWSPEQPHAIEHAALIGGRIVVHHARSMCRAGCRCSASTAAPTARSRCRASARSPTSTAAADHYEVWFVVQLAAARRPRCIATTSNRAAACAFEPPSPPIDRVAV